MVERDRSRASLSPHACSTACFKLMLADLPSVTKWPRVPQMHKASQKGPDFSGTTLETRNRRGQGTKNTEESGSYKHEVFLFTSSMPVILYAWPRNKGLSSATAFKPYCDSHKGKTKLTQNADSNGPEWRSSNSNIMHLPLPR